MPQLRYHTPLGITVTRTETKLAFSRGLGHILKQLDSKRGAYFSSGYEYPERYSRWDVATLAPPIEIVGRDRTLALNALNERGRVILRLLHPLVEGHAHWDCEPATADSFTLRLKPLADRFPEEERSKQPSPFSLVRFLVKEFGNPADTRLMLAGAFGYDLLLQFDPITQRLPRQDQKTLHLFLCDDIYFMDRKKEVIEHYQYDFEGTHGSTAGLDRATPSIAKSKKRRRPPKSSRTTKPKSIWRRWKSCAKACAKVTITK